MSERDYSFRAFIEGCHILAKYMENGLDTNFALGAEHEIVYFYVQADKVSPEDAEKLESLKFYKDEDVDAWSYNA